MAQLDFFFDPVCPWAWITSRWVVNVLEEQPMEVDWRFICLRIVNEERLQPVPRGLRAGAHAWAQAAAGGGRRPGRAGSGVRAPQLYTAFGRTIHLERNAVAFDDPSGVERIVDSATRHVWPKRRPAPSTTTWCARRRSRHWTGAAATSARRCTRSRHPTVRASSAPSSTRRPRARTPWPSGEAVMALGLNPHFSESTLTPGPARLQLTIRSPTWSGHGWPPRPLRYDVPWARSRARFAGRREP